MVMLHGRRYSIPWEKEHIPAILEAWYRGEFEIMTGSSAKDIRIKKDFIDIWRQKDKIK